MIKVLNRTSDVTRRYHLTDDWPDGPRASGTPDENYSIRLGPASNPVYGSGVRAFFEHEPCELDDADALAAAQRNLAAFLRKCGYGEWLDKLRISPDGSPVTRRHRIARESTAPHGRCRDGYCVEHAANPRVESCS